MGTTSGAGHRLLWPAIDRQTTKTDRLPYRYDPERGSALLAVLWVSAALAAIAFSLSSTVLGETQRTSTDVDGLRAYYLAAGGLERAEYELLWAAGSPDKFTIRRDSGRVSYSFPSGDVQVEIIPEAAKLSVNQAPPEELYKLLTALGLEPERAGQITAAIVDWRSGGRAARSTNIIGRSRRLFRLATRLSKRSRNYCR